MIRVTRRCKYGWLACKCVGDNLKKNWAGFRLPLRLATAKAINAARVRSNSASTEFGHGLPFKTREPMVVVFIRLALQAVLGTRGNELAVSVSDHVRKIVPKCSI